MAITGHRPSLRSFTAAGTTCAAVALAAVLTGCGSTSSPTAANHPPPTTATGGGGPSPQRQPASYTSYYLALGDSLAAGVQPAPAGPSPQPKKIKAGATPTQGYVNDLFNAETSKVNSLGLENLGCPGETTTTMIDGGKCSYPAGSQLAQAVQFIQGHKIAFITIDIGGDDIDACVTTATINQTCVNDGIDAIRANLPKILRALRQAAGPKAEIVVMTYYDPFLGTYLTGPAGQALAAESVALTTQVNHHLLSASTGNNVRIADVASAFDTYTPFKTTTTYLGRTVPVAVANVCNWTWMCSAPPVGPNVHANATGYREIASTFEKNIYS